MKIVLDQNFKFNLNMEKTKLTVLADIWRCLNQTVLSVENTIAYTT